MSKHTDVMVDLETLSTHTDAFVLTIGAVAFTPRLPEEQYFYTTLDISMPQGGGHIDPQTVAWWMGQSDQARKTITNPPTRLPPRTALSEFDAFIANTTVGAAKVKVWGNGAAFDNVILRALYARLGATAPWAWWNDRCYRTMKNLAALREPERQGTYHHALDDAIHQTRHLQRIFREA